MAKEQSFVLGKEKFPSWFNGQCVLGRANVNLDDDNNLENVKIFSPSGTLIANKGDTIVLFKSGLSVIPKFKNKLEEVKIEDTEEDEDI